MSFPTKYPLCVLKIHGIAVEDLNSIVKMKFSADNENLFIALRKWNPLTVPSADASGGGEWLGGRCRQITRIFE
jgi:hypothetical protein